MSESRYSIVHNVKCHLCNLDHSFESNDCNEMNGNILHFFLTKGGPYLELLKYKRFCARFCFSLLLGSMCTMA